MTKSSSTNFNTLIIDKSKLSVTDQLQISIIIPTLNEEETIGIMVRHLLKCKTTAFLELLVIDAGSQDDTVQIAKKEGATVLKSPQPGRAAQMNYGAKIAKGNLLYFVHADNIPPDCYMTEVEKAVKEGYPMGCFRFKFDSNHPLLKINTFFNRFNKLWCRGGDQTLFITREIFDHLGGYPDGFIIMEEYELLQSAFAAKIPFKIIPKFVLGSARKYETNSYLRVQIANFIVFRMYKKGASQEDLARTYKRLLDYR